MVAGGYATANAAAPVAARRYRKGMDLRASAVALALVLVAGCGASSPPPPEEGGPPSIAAMRRSWAEHAGFHWERGVGECLSGRCEYLGWTVRDAAGDPLSTSTCFFNSCPTDGWETRFADGGVAKTVCQERRCLESGWISTLPDGTRAVATCRRSTCAVFGWDLELSTGDAMRCTCAFDDCTREPVVCRRVD